ncbi:CHAP domain protein [Chlamydiales bacterium STE3]|nr:CHAP domain protein [Chlamydiales bacterium STE3]
MEQVSRTHLLCEIARKEGELHFSESFNKAGPQIEKYLKVFRKTLYEISQHPSFMDLNHGYDWCCAFVYYCCQQAGYEIPIRASENPHHTLAAVGTWVKYAQSQNIWYERQDSNFLPRAGDLIIFDKIISEELMDHIGILIDYNHGKKICETAEGNINQSTGIFKRSVNEKIKGYIRLPD